MTDQTEARALAAIRLYDNYKSGTAEEWAERRQALIRACALSPEKEAAIQGLVEAALEAVRVAQAEGSGSYESTLELAGAIERARLAGLTKE